MIHKFFERLDPEILKGLIDFIILKMITLLNNSKDNDIKLLLSENLELALTVLNREKIDSYIDKVVGWLNDKNDQSLQKLALSVYI